MRRKKGDVASPVRQAVSKAADAGSNPAVPIPATATCDEEDVTWNQNAELDGSEIVYVPKAHADELHARIQFLEVRLALHHFGDHGSECDRCGVMEPSEVSIEILVPLGIVSDSGAVLHHKKAQAFLEETDQ